MNKLRKKKVTIFMRWRLKIKGWNDAKNKIPIISPINDKYYYTPFIGEQVAEFISLAEEEFSKIRDVLTKLNESISNLNFDCKTRFDKASADISDKKREIAINIRKPETPERETFIVVLNTQINEIERVAGNDIEKINSLGSKNENDARKILENYHIRFNQGLNNCIERLEIYWGSLFIKNKKMETEVNINPHLSTGEELMVMCRKVNPATGFNIIHYEVITFQDIEMLKHKV